MFKKLATTMALSLCVVAQTIAYAESESVIGRAIANIKSNSTISGTVFALDSAVGGLGITSAGIGATGIELKFLPEVAGKWLIKIGAKAAAIGGTGMAISAIIAVFEPSPAKSDTLTDYFLTPEGFKMYLTLPADQMENYANWDQRLADLVLRVSDGVDQVKAKNGLN